MGSRSGEPVFKKDWVRVRHMLDAAREIHRFCRGIDSKGFSANRMLNLAVLKDLEIIGEAASRVSLEFREKFSGVPWQAIIDTRNRLIHGYFDVDLKVIWDTVERDVPELVKVLQQLFEKPPGKSKEP